MSLIRLSNLIQDCILSLQKANVGKFSKLDRYDGLRPTQHDSTYNLQISMAYSVKIALCNAVFRRK